MGVQVEGRGEVVTVWVRGVKGTGQRGVDEEGMRVEIWRKVRILVREGG